jgi:hypothetical protein
MVVGKIAFLFLTKGNHNCENLWNLFFKNIPPNLYNIYCHPKKLPTQLFLRNNIITDRIETRWGDISLVVATILLLKAAYKDEDNKYFILLSDSCCPIVDFFFLKNKIELVDKSWISYRYSSNKLSRYHSMNDTMKKYIPLNHFYSQHQWMILRRDHVNIIITNNLISKFKNINAVDEHYFVCLLFLYKLLNTQNILNKKITYCDWSNIKEMHPTEFTNITDGLLQKAHMNGCFFIRKIKCYHRTNHSLESILTNNYK